MGTSPNRPPKTLSSNPDHSPQAGGRWGSRTASFQQSSRTWAASPGVSLKLAQKGQVEVATLSHRNWHMYVYVRRNMLQVIYVCWPCPKRAVFLQDNMRLLFLILSMPGVDSFPWREGMYFRMCTFPYLRKRIHLKVCFFSQQSLESLYLSLLDGENTYLMMFHMSL